MFRRPLAALASATIVPLLLLAVAAPAAAGGWADVKADATTGEPPIEGRATEVGFTVLQHGVTPAGWVTPTVTFRNIATGEEVATAARATGSEGHFVATAELPAGYWTWLVTLPELINEAPPVTIAVRTAAGAFPTLDPTTLIAAIEQAKRDTTTEVYAVTGPQINDLSDQLGTLRIEVASLEGRVKAISGERDLLAARLADAGVDADGAVPVVGLLMLSILAGAAAGFAMAWLAGRPGPRVTPEPAPQGAHPG